MPSPKHHSLNAEPGHFSVEVRPITFSMRPYFSSYLLWTAEEMSARAGAIEASHEGPGRFDMEHRSYVLSSFGANVAVCAAGVATRRALLATRPGRSSQPRPPA